MTRSIPSFIGRIKVPETREVTIQLLTCWANLMHEYSNIQPLFINLMSPLPTDTFFRHGQEIAMYLANKMDELKIIPKCNDMIYVGEPKLVIGHLNCKIAGLLHRYYDEPDFKIRGKYPPITKEQQDEAKRKEQQDESPCPQEVPC